MANHLVPRISAGRPQTTPARQHPKRRLLLATACSLAIHFGVTAIAALHMKEELPPTPVEETTAPPLPPPLPPQIRVEPPTLTEAEKAQLLERLKMEKQELIQKIAHDLHTGEPTMTISDFLIKSEVLDRNISALESGSADLVDENTMRREYNSILREVRRRVALFEGTGERLDILHYFSHTNLFQGYLKGSSGILDVLLNGTYNCATSTLFLASLEADLVNSENYGVVILDPPEDPSMGKMGHMLSWFEEGETLWQIENTDGGYPRRTPFQKGLRVPKEMIYAAYLINNGLSVDQLPQNLAQYYRLGVGIGGYPVAGVSTDLPDPPDSFMPNPYFIGSKTKIIKEARAIATMLAFFQGQESPASTSINLSLIRIPRDVDWCEIAENNTIGMGSRPLEISKIIERINAETSTIFSDDYFNLMGNMYLTATKAADFLPQMGDDNFTTCTRENEHRKFENLAERILAGENLQIGYDNFTAIAYPQKSRVLLLKLFQSPNTSQTVKEEALYWLSIIHSPEDFELFKAIFLNYQQPDQHVLRISSALGLSHMEGEKAREAANLLLSAYSTKKDNAIAWGLINLGYGKTALDYITGIPAAEQDAVWQKRALSNAIRRLHPTEPPSAEDLRRIKTLIENEADIVTRTNLIALLANLGNTEEALTYVERYILPLLSKKDLDDVHEAGTLVLSLGKINDPQIRSWLLSVLDIHPELAIEIGDVFVRQNFRSEKVVAELKKILDNIDTELSETADPGEIPGRRVYAALLLILMGEDVN